MAEILVVGTNDLFESELVRFLSQRRHRVASCAIKRSELHNLEQYASHAKLVILDVTANTGEHWDILRRLSRLKREQRDPGPMLLCVSRIYLGPTTELEIERKGARLV